MIVIEHETEFEAINAEASRRLRGQCVRVASVLGYCLASAPTTRKTVVDVWQCTMWYGLLFVLDLVENSAV